jgi:hypothetical protein
VLEELKKGHATESEIAQKLSVPLSTIHYNVQQLVKTGLVIGDQFHYSGKGREVSHYRLTNKVIVIAPKGTIMDQFVKALVPVVLVIAAGTGFVYQITNKATSLSMSALNSIGGAAPIMAAKSAAVTQPIMEETINAGDLAVMTASNSIQTAMNVANDTTTTVIANQVDQPLQIAQTFVPAVSSDPNYALWFFVGAVIIAGLSLLGMWLWNRNR